VPKNVPLVLHICCAPCLIYPLKKLREQDFDIHGFFYNPNIHPCDEYALRENTLKEFSRRAACRVNFSTEKSESLFDAAIGENRDKPQRCFSCWSMRLKKTAEYARSIDVDTISTTLLVSPYQDQAMVKKAGEQAAADAGLKFYYYDFREGYPEAVRISKQEGLYRQKYCGCRFSREERREKVKS